jgi:molecular chaperone HscB
MSVDFSKNYFELFELECSFQIDFDKLEKRYLSFQRKFHPDKFVNATDYEKRLSLQVTSYVNEAYETLKNDYLKSMYLLKIKGYEMDSQNSTISDPEFLMQQMQLREESEEILLTEDSKLFKNFLLNIKNLKKNCIEDFERKYNELMFDDAAKKINEMKFYISIENDLKRKK